MLALVTPHLRLASVLELEADHLHLLGLDGLLLDVDCTLKDYHKDYHADGFHPEVIAWVRSLHARGIRLCILSNGRTRRVEALARELGVSFVARAFKPFPFGCRRALTMLGLDGGRVALVGDQLFACALRAQRSPGSPASSAPSSVGFSGGSRRGDCWAFYQPSRRE